MEHHSFHDHNPGGPSGALPRPQQQQPQPQQQHGGPDHPQHQRQESQGSPSGQVPAVTQGPPQLPPQLFTTAAQLLDLTDKKLVLILRDGRKLIGVLRSWDQFANLVLQETIERLYAGKIYCEIPRGVYLVRGENVLLLGELDLDKEEEVPAPFEKAPVDEVVKLKKEEDAKRKQSDKRQGNKLQALGFEAEHSGEILF